MAVEKDIQTALNRVVDTCIERSILKSLSDREFQKKLFVELGLEEGKTNARQIDKGAYVKYNY